MSETDIIKRAFDLAPECGSIDELKRRLSEEGYLQVSAHLSGPQIQSQLKTRLDPHLKPIVRER